MYILHIKNKGIIISCYPLQICGTGSIKWWSILYAWRALYLAKKNLSTFFLLLFLLFFPTSNEAENPSSGFINHGIFWVLSYCETQIMSRRIPPSWSRALLAQSGIFSGFNLSVRAEMWVPRSVHKVRNGIPNFFMTNIPDSSWISQYPSFRGPIS